MTAGSASIHRGSSAEDGACGIEAHVMLGQSSDIANLPTRRAITRVQNGITRVDQRRAHFHQNHAVHQYIISE